MSKPNRFANEEVMEDYLGSLLSENNVSDETGYLEQKKAVAEKLLTESQLIDTPVIKAERDVSVPELEVEQTSEEIGTQPLIKHDIPIAEQLEENFQALFFEVAGLTLAVPLVTLGGIHQVDNVSPLFGKPSWFKGVMLHRDEKLNVVDTAKWVMPEKITQTLEEGLHYSYLVMLAESTWGLACEKLVDTVSLNKSDVKWRENDKKRPWLAGMVKERMCALIDVYQLVSMLNKGLNSDSQD
ncbi:chemotaxis protein CheW [Alteromonas sp. 5E99-2]|uniref:chemotaxis protein CheW n=1 Tax=Alteromonas sp. 5E99-2 TaxID=2817683 RepID=UPI001A982A6C|nr:chemotaxis protein CheW [Alteromonas sp. 5E99-2]MBO1255207.1 chemotaxis protein CheW [Alteromonas sp. 5E99-2]